MVEHSSAALRAKSNTPVPYVGRFAPAPTGALHFGSLITAVGSYLQALTHEGRWLLRIDDIDQTRQVVGAADSILSTLAAFGFEWHGAVVHQSDRLERYQEAIELLSSRELIYACTCSRAQIAAQNPSAENIDEIRYPGTCRMLNHARSHAALRFLIDARADNGDVDGEVHFTDHLQGQYRQNVHNVCGDFVVKRRDGLFAYHLAVVVDDADQGVTEVVRGADLLASTPRQILLQRALSLPTPHYCHLPLAVDSRGYKLSKSVQSLPIESAQAAPLLWHALEFLRQTPPCALQNASINEIWQWAREHWNPQTLTGIYQTTAPAPAHSMQL